MPFELQERRNERDGRNQAMLEVRDSHRDMRVLRPAGLSGDHLLPLRERRHPRPAAVQAAHHVHDSLTTSAQKAK
jgi:hypothetical protein